MNDQPDPRIARLDFLIAEQDQRERDRNRLRLLDRICRPLPTARVGEGREVEWMELADGDEALVLDRSRLGEGTGCYLMNDGDDVLAIGPLGRPDVTGVVVIRRDGSCQLREVAPGPDA